MKTHIPHTLSGQKKQDKLILEDPKIITQVAMVSQTHNIYTI